MTVLVSDSFNRANGVLGSTDSYLGGTSLAWQTSTANFIISSNKGSVNALDDTQFAYVDCGQSNVSVSLDFSQTSTLGNCPKLFFRGTNFTNAYVIYWVSSGWQLYKLVNGVLTSLSSSTILGGPTSTNIVTVKVTCSGNSISWYLNGTLVSTITDSTFTGTKHGWGTQRVQGLADNFIIEDLNTGGTGTTYTGAGTAQGVSSLTATEKQILNALGTAQGQTILTTQDILKFAENGTTQGISLVSGNAFLLLKENGSSVGQSSLFTSEIFISGRGTIYSEGGISQGYSFLIANERMIHAPIPIPMIHLNGHIVSIIQLKGYVPSVIQLKGNASSIIQLKGGKP